jgi:hypothetical protein
MIRIVMGGEPQEATLYSQNRHRLTVALCKDRPGVKRTVVHVRLMEIIRKFFEKHLA